MIKVKYIVTTFMKCCDDEAVVAKNIASLIEDVIKKLETVEGYKVKWIVEKDA